VTAVAVPSGEAVRAPKAIGRIRPIVGSISIVVVRSAISVVAAWIDITWIVRRGVVVRVVKKRIVVGIVGVIVRIIVIATVGPAVEEPDR